MAIINQNVGLGAAGCPVNADGDCELNGMPVSCSLIRECDSMTGALHYEYAMPQSTGNVNINVADPNSGKIIGYNDSQGRFIDTADVDISSLTNAPNRAAQTQQAIVGIEQAKAQAAREAASQGLNAFQTAIKIAQAAASASAASGASASVVNTQAGQVTGAIVNTRQTTTSQQGAPATAQMVNKNTATGGGRGNNSVTPTPGATISNSSGINFGDLMSAGSSWLEQESYGIKNSYWAIGAAIAIAIGGGYVGGRRGR